MRVSAREIFYALVFHLHMNLHCGRGTFYTASGGYIVCNIYVLHFSCMTTHTDGLEGVHVLVVQAGAHYSSSQRKDRSILSAVKDSCR